MAKPSRGEFWFARFCFIFAAIVAITSFAWLTHEMALTVQKAISAALVGAVISLGLVLALDWINRKEILAAESAPATSSGATSQPLDKWPR